MQWLELTVHTTTAAIDLLAAELTVLGYDSFIIDDQADFHKFLEENRQYWDYVDAELEERMRGLSQIRLYLEENAGVMDEVAALRLALAHWRTRCPVDPGTLEITCTAMQNEDWENNWKQYYQPIAIGARLLVVPQWLTPENPEHRVEVRLDPGMIFGTGAHASTQMCMQALEQAVHGGERVIDLGSGSGILSITALLLGAASATGVDIDPKAEDIARANAAMNGLTDEKFQAVTADVLADRGQMDALSAGGYEIVLANIVADVIIPLSAVVPQFLRPGGLFLCSGILDRRLDEVQAAIGAAGLEILQAPDDGRLVPDHSAQSVSGTCADLPPARLVCRAGGFLTDRVYHNFCKRNDADAGYTHVPQSYTQRLPELSRFFLKNP